MAVVVMRAWSSLTVACKDFFELGVAAYAFHTQIYVCIDILGCFLFLLRYRFNVSTFNSRFRLVCLSCLDQIWRSPDTENSFHALCER